MKRFFRHNRRRLILTAVTTLAITIVALTLTFGVRWTSPSQPDGNGNSSINNPNNYVSVSDKASLISKLESATINEDIQLTGNITIAESDLTLTYNSSNGTYATNIGKAVLSSGKTFDGNGYTITLQVSSHTLAFSSTGNYSGLFSQNNGTIKNLNVVYDSNVTAFGVHGMGGLTGLNTGTIENCTVTINSGKLLKGQWSGHSAAGGLVGINGNASTSGTIIDCEVNIHGNVAVYANGAGLCYVVGGAVGAMQRGTIDGLRVAGAGNITKQTAGTTSYWGAMGGIIGYMRATDGDNNFSVDINNISLSDLQYAFTGTYSYSAASENFLAAIIGDASNVSVNIAGLYYSVSNLDIETSSVSHNVGTGSGSTAYNTDNALYAVARASSISVSNSYFAVSTIRNYSAPVDVSTADELVAALSGSNSINLRADITVSGSSLGSVVWTNAINGFGHSITLSAGNVMLTGGSIDNSNYFAGGLVAVNQGVIKNVRLVINSTLGTSSRVRAIGGLVGYNLGTIDDCKVTISNTGAVKAYYSNGEDTAAGGLVGVNGRSETGAGIINNSFVTLNGTVYAKTFGTSSHCGIGGVVGFNLNGTLTNVGIYGSGTVQGESSDVSTNAWKFYGGIVGGNRGGHSTGTDTFMVLGSTSYSTLTYAFTGKFAYGQNGGETYVGKIFGASAALTLDKLYYLDPKPENGTFGNKYGTSGEVSANSTGLYMIGTGTDLTVTSFEEIILPTAYIGPSAMDYGNVFTVKEEGIGSISGAAELAAFLKGEGAYSSIGYGYLTQDIIYTSSTTAIAGTFAAGKTLDGNGFSIIFNATTASLTDGKGSHGYATGSSADSMLIGTNNGVVKNLKVVMQGKNKFASPSGNTDNYFSAVVGNNAGAIENVSVIIEDGALLAGEPGTPSAGGKNAYFGLVAAYNTGYVGYAGAYIGTGAQIEHWGSHTATDRNVYTAGVVGYNHADGVVEYCSVYGDGLVNSTSSSGNIYVGGIVGYNAGSVDYCYGGFYGNYQLSAASYLGAVVGYSAADKSYSGLGTYIGGGSATLNSSNWSGGKASSDTHAYNDVSGGIGMGLVGAYATSDTSTSPTFTGSYFVRNTNHSSVKVRGFFNYSSPDGILLLELDKPEKVSAYSLSSSNSSHNVDVVKNSSIAENACAAYDATTCESYVYTGARTDTDLVTLTVGATVSTAVDALDLANSGYATSSAFHGYSYTGTEITSSTTFPLYGSTNYYLTQDVTISLSSNYTVANNANEYSGTLHGNGHTITFTGNGSYTAGYSAMGLLSGWFSGNFYDVNIVLDGTLSFNNFSADGYGSGIFAGIYWSGTIDNCSLTINSGAQFINDNTGQQKQGAHAGFVGKIVDHNNTSATINNIYFKNNGTITAKAAVNGNDKGWVTVGGIIGLIAGGNTSGSLWNLQKFFITGSGTISTTQGGYTTTTLLGSFTTTCNWNGNTIDNHSQGNLMEYVYLQDYSMTLSDAESRYGIYGVNQSGTTNAGVAARVHKGTGVSATLTYVAMNNNNKTTISNCDVSSIGTIHRSTSGAYVYSKANATLTESSRYIRESVDMTLNSASHNIIRRYTALGAVGAAGADGNDRHALYVYSTSNTSINYILATNNSYYKTDGTSNSKVDISVLNRYSYSVRKLGLEALDVAEAVLGRDGTGSAVLGSATGVSEISGSTQLNTGYNVISDTTHFGLIIKLPTAVAIDSVHSTYGAPIDAMYKSGSDPMKGVYGVRYGSGEEASQTTVANAKYSDGYATVTTFTPDSAYTVYLNASPTTIYTNNKYVTYYIINNDTYISSEDYSGQNFAYAGTPRYTQLKKSDGTAVPGYIHQFKLDNITYTGDNTVYNGNSQNVDYEVGVYPSGKHDEAKSAITPTDFAKYNAGNYVLKLTLSETGNYAFGLDDEGNALYVLTHNWTIAKAPIALNLTKTTNEISKYYDGQSNIINLTNVAEKLHDDSKTIYTGSFSTNVNGLKDNMSGRLSYNEPTTFVGQDEFKGVGVYDVELSLSQGLMGNGTDNVSNFVIENIVYTAKAQYEIKSVLIKTNVTGIQGEPSREYTAAKQYFASSSLAGVDVDGALEAQFTAYGKTTEEYNAAKTALQAEASQYMDVAYIYAATIVNNEYTFFNSAGTGILGALTTGGAVNAGKYKYFGYSLSGNFRVEVDALSGYNAADVAYATVFNGADTEFKVTRSDWTALGALFGYNFNDLATSNDKKDKLAALIARVDGSTVTTTGSTSTVTQLTEAQKAARYSAISASSVTITKASVSIVADDQSVEYGADLLAAGTLRSDAYTISALPDAMSKAVFKQSLIDNGFSWSVNEEEYGSILKSYTIGGHTVKYLEVRYDGDGAITAWSNAIAPSEYVDNNLNITYIYGNLTVYQKELQIEWIYNGSAEATALYGGTLPSAYQDSSYSAELGAYVYDGAPHTMTLHRKVNLLPGDEAVSTIVSHTGSNAISGTNVGTYGGFYVYFDPSQSGTTWKNYYLGDGASGAFKIVKREVSGFGTPKVDFTISGQNNFTYLSLDHNATPTIKITIPINSITINSSTTVALGTILNTDANKEIIKNAASFTYQATPNTWATISGDGWDNGDNEVKIENNNLILTIKTAKFENNTTNDGREAAYSFVLGAMDLDGANVSTLASSVVNDWIAVKSSSYSASASNYSGGSWTHARSISVSGNRKTANDTNWNDHTNTSGNTSVVDGVVIVNSGTQTLGLNRYKGFGEALKQKNDNGSIITRQYYQNTSDNETGIEYYRSSNGTSTESNLFTGLAWFDITTTDLDVARKLKTGAAYYDISGIFKTYGEYSGWGAWFFGPAYLSVLVYGIDDAYDQSIIYGTDVRGRYKHISSYTTNMGLTNGVEYTSDSLWTFTPAGYGSWNSYQYYGATSSQKLVTTQGIKGYSSYRVVFMTSMGDQPSTWDGSYVHSKIANLSVALQNGTAGADTVTDATADNLNLNVSSGNTIYASDVHRLTDGNIRFTIESNNKSKIDISSVKATFAPTTTYTSGAKTLTVGNGLKVVETYSANNTSFNLYNTYKATFETQLEKYMIGGYYLSDIQYGTIKTWNGEWVRNDTAQYGTDIIAPNIYISSVDGINYTNSAADQARAQESLYGGWVNKGTKIVQVVATEAHSNAGWSNGVNSVYSSGLKSLDMSTSAQFGTGTKTQTNAANSYGDISLTLTIEAGKAYYLRATDCEGNTVVKTLYFETNDTYSGNNLEIAVRPEERNGSEAEENVWTNKDIIMLLSGRGEGNSLARLYYRRIYTSRIPSEDIEVFKPTSAATSSVDGYTEISTWAGLKAWLEKTADTSDAYKYGRLTDNITVPALGTGEEATVLSLNQGRLLDGNGKTLIIDASSALRKQTVDVMLNAMTFTDVGSRFLYENNGTITDLKVSVSGITNELSKNTVYSPFVAVNNGILSGIEMTVSETSTTGRNGYEYTVVVGGLTAINRGYVTGADITLTSLTVSPKASSNSNANVVLGGLTAVNDSGTIKGNTVSATVSGSTSSVSVTANSGYEAHGALVATLVNYSVTNFDLIDTLNIVVRGNAYTHNPVTDNTVTGYAVAATSSDKGSTVGVGVAKIFTGSDVNYGWIALQANESGEFIASASDEQNAWIIDHSGVYSLEMMIESGTGDRAFAVYSSGGNLYYNSFDKLDPALLRSKEVDVVQQHTHDSTAVYELSGGKFVNPESGSSTSYDYYTASYNSTSGVYTVVYNGVGGTTETYTVNPTTQEVRETISGTSTIVGTAISSGTSVSTFYVNTDKFLVDFSASSVGTSITLVRDAGEYSTPASEGYFNVKIDKRTYNVAFDTVVDIDNTGTLSDPTVIDDYISYSIKKNDSAQTAISAYANVNWGTGGPAHTSNGSVWKLGTDNKLYEFDNNGALMSTAPISVTVSYDADGSRKLTYGGSVYTFGYFFYTLPSSSENDRSTWTNIEMNTVMSSTTEGGSTWYGIAEIETFKVTNGKIDRTVVLSSFNGTEWDMKEVGSGNVALNWSRLASVNVPRGDDADDMEEAFNMIVIVHIKYYASVDIVTTDSSGNETQLASDYGVEPTATTYTSTVSSTAVKGTTAAQTLLDGKTASFYALDLTGNDIYYNPTSYAIYDVDDSGDYRYYTKQLLAAQGVRGTELYSIDLYNADPSLMVNKLTPVGDHHLVLKEITLSDAAVSNYVLNFNVKSYYKVNKRSVYVNIDDNFGKLYDGSAVWKADINRTGPNSTTEPNVLKTDSYTVKAPQYSYLSADPSSTTTRAKYNFGSYNTGESMTFAITTDGTVTYTSGSGSTSTTATVGSASGNLTAGTYTVIAYGHKYTVGKTVTTSGYPVYFNGVLRGYLNSVGTSLTIYTAPVEISYGYFMLHSGSDEIETPNVGGALKLFFSDKSYYKFGTIENATDYTVTDDVPVYTGDEREIEDLEKVGTYTESSGTKTLEFELGYTTYSGITVSGTSVKNSSNQIIGSVNDYGNIVFNSSSFTPVALRGETLILEDGIVYNETEGWSAVELGSAYARMYKRAIYVRAAGLSVSETTVNKTFDGTIQAGSAEAGLSEETDSDAIGSGILPIWGALNGETAQLNTAATGSSAVGTTAKPILAGSYVISYKLSNLSVGQVYLDGITTNTSQAINSSSTSDNYYVHALIKTSTNDTTYNAKLNISEASNMLYVNRVMGSDGSYRVRVTVSNLAKNINGLQFLNAGGDFIVDGVDYFSNFISVVDSQGTFDLSLETSAKQIRYNEMQALFAKADGNTTSKDYLAAVAIRNELASDVRYLAQKALGRIFRYAVNSTKSFATVSVAYNKDSFSNFHYDKSAGKLTFDYLGDSAKDSAYLADRYSVKIAGGAEALTNEPGQNFDSGVVNSSNISMTTSSLSDGQVTFGEYNAYNSTSSSSSSATADTPVAIGTAAELKSWLSMTSTTAAGYKTAYLTDNILGFDWGVESINGVVYGGAKVGLAAGRTLDGRGYSIELAGNQVSQSGGNIAMHVPLNADNTKKAITTGDIQKSTSAYASGVFLQYIAAGAQIKNINFVYTANRYYVEDTSSYVTSVISNNTVTSSTNRAVGIIAGVVTTSATTVDKASLYNIALEIRGKFGYKGTDGTANGGTEGTYAIGGIAGIIDGTAGTYGMVNSTIYYYASPEVGNIDWTWSANGSYDIYIERAVSGTTSYHPHMAYGALVGVLSRVTIKNISTRTELMSDNSAQPKIYVGNSGTCAWMFVGGGIGFSRNTYSGVIDGYINKFKGKIVLSNQSGEAYVGAISGCTYNSAGSAKFSNVYSYYNSYSLGNALTSNTDFIVIGSATKNSEDPYNLTGSGTLQGTDGALALTANTNLTVGYDGSTSSGSGLIDYYFGSNNYGSTYETTTDQEYVDYYYNTVFINGAEVKFNPFGYKGWTPGTIIYDSYLRKTENKVGTTNVSTTNMDNTPASGETFTINGVTYTITAYNSDTNKVTASIGSTTSGSVTAGEETSQTFTFDTNTFSFVNDKTGTKYYYGKPHEDSSTSAIKTADSSSINIEVLAPNGYFVWDYHLANYTNTLTEQGAVTRLVWSIDIGEAFNQLKSNGEIGYEYYATATSDNAGLTDEKVYYYNAGGRNGSDFWTKNWHNAVLGTYAISASDAASSEFVYEYTGDVVEEPISVTVHVTYVNKNTNQLIDEYYTAKIQMTEEMVNVGSYVVSEFDGAKFEDSATEGKTDIKKMTRVLTDSSSGNQIMIIIVPKSVTLDDDATITKTYDGTDKYVVDKDSINGWLGKNSNESDIVLPLNYNSSDVATAGKVTSGDNNSRAVLVDASGNYMSFVKDSSYTENFTKSGDGKNAGGYTAILGSDSYAYYTKTGDTTNVYDEFGKAVGTIDSDGNVAIKGRYYLSTISYAGGLYEGTAGKFNKADNIPAVAGWIEQTAEEMNKLRAFYYAYMQIIPLSRFLDTPFYDSYDGTEQVYSTADNTKYKVVEIYNLYANVLEKDPSAIRFNVLPVFDDGGNGVTARNYALLPDNYYVNPFIIKDLAYDMSGSTLKVGNVSVGTVTSSTLNIDNKEYTLASGTASSTTQITVNYTYANSVFTLKIAGKEYTTNSDNKILDGSTVVGSYTKTSSGTSGTFAEDDSIVLYGVEYAVTGTATDSFTATATVKFGYSNGTIDTSASTGMAGGSDANFSHAASITARELDVEYSNLIWDKDSSASFTAPSAELSFNIESDSVKSELDKHRLTTEERTALNTEYSGITVTIVDSQTNAAVSVTGVSYYKTTLAATISNQNFAIKVNKNTEGAEVAAYLGQNTLTTKPVFLYSTLSGEKQDGDTEYYLVVKDLDDLQLLVTKTELSDASIRLSQDIDASDLTGSINWGSRSTAVFDGQNHVVANCFVDTIFVQGVIGTVKNVMFTNVESWADDNGEILGLGTGGTASNVVIHGTDISGNTPKSTTGIKYEMIFVKSDGTYGYVSEYLPTLATQFSATDATEAQKESILSFVNTYVLKGRFTATAANNGLSDTTPLLIGSANQLLDAIASFPNLYFKLTSDIYLKSNQSINVEFVDRKAIDFGTYHVYKSDGTEVATSDVNKTSQSND